MREVLKNISESDYWVYGVGESDINHAVDLVKEMINARMEQYQKKAERVHAENPDAADDILDDVAYYNYTDNQFLWHFCLWRLQGLFEAIIVHELLEYKSSKKLIGLRAKIKQLELYGYTLDHSEKEELFLWANLRNAISHAPPEQYRPSPLCEEDVMEYKQFIIKLYNRWVDEKKDLKK